MSPQEEIDYLHKKSATLAETAEGFIEVVEAAIRSRRNKGGQQVPYFGDFASIAPSAIRDLEYWAKRFKLSLDGPKCQCQWEAGDSPCKVHGEGD
jgi:hypothetical protein